MGRRHWSLCSALALGLMATPAWAAQDKDKDDKDEDAAAAPRKAPRNPAAQRPAKPTAPAQKPRSQGAKGDGQSDTGARPSGPRRAPDAPARGVPASGLGQGPEGRPFETRPTRPTRPQTEVQAPGPFKGPVREGAGVGPLDSQADLQTDGPTRKAPGQGGGEDGPGQSEGGAHNGGGQGGGQQDGGGHGGSGHGDGQAHGAHGQHPHHGAHAQHGHADHVRPAPSPPPSAHPHHGPRWFGSTKVFVYAPPSPTKTVVVHGRSAPAAPSVAVEPEAEAKPSLRAVDRSGQVMLGVRAAAVASDLDTPVLGLGLGLGFRPVESVGLEIAGTVHGGGPEDGIGTEVPIQVSANLYAFSWTRVSPYLTGGWAWNVRDVHEAESALRRQTLHGPHAGLGLELALGQGAAFHIEGTATGYLDPAGQVVIGAGALQATGGLNLYF